MKEYTRVNKEIEKARKTLAKTTKEIESIDNEKRNLRDTLLSDGRKATDEERKEFDTYIEKLAKLHEKKRDTELLLLVLKNNLKIALYKDIFPAVLEILKKYENKSLGEKTKEKLRNEIKDTFNCGMYIDCNYSNAIVIYTLNKDGYSNNGCEIKVGTENYSKKHLIDNKVQIYNISEYYLQDVNSLAYDNPKAHVKEMKKAHKKAYAAYQKAQDELSKFNNLSVSGLDHAYITSNRLYNTL